MGYRGRYQYQYYLDHMICQEWLQDRNTMGYIGNIFWYNVTSRRDVTGMIEIRLIIAPDFSYSLVHSNFAGGISASMKTGTSKWQYV